MKIIDKTRNTVLAEDAKVAVSIVSRIKGLLGRKKLGSGEALIIKRCNAVHTFFMRFAIDILFLDKDNRLVKIIPSFKPFRLTAVYLKAVTTIELPAGASQAASVEEGDIIQFEP